MTYEVVEYKNGTRKVHLKTTDGSEARDEFRWLEDRKEQHDGSMGLIKIETMRA